jgi:hypothetical protein
MVCVLLCVVVCALALPFIASQSPFNYFVLSNQQTHTETWHCSDNYSVAFKQHRSSSFQLFCFVLFLSSVSFHSITDPSKQQTQTDGQAPSINKEKHQTNKIAQKQTNQHAN